LTPPSAKRGAWEREQLPCLPLSRGRCRPQAAEGVDIIIRANKKNMSKVVGHKRKNIQRLKEKFNFNDIKIVEDNNAENLYFIRRLANGKMY